MVGSPGGAVGARVRAGPCEPNPPAVRAGCGAGRAPGSGQGWGAAAVTGGSPVSAARARGEAPPSQSALGVPRAEPTDRSEHRWFMSSG